MELLSGRLGHKPRKLACLTPTIHDIRPASQLVTGPSPSALSSSYAIVHNIIGGSRGRQGGGAKTHNKISHVSCSIHLVLITRSVLVLPTDGYYFTRRYAAVCLWVCLSVPITTSCT